MIMNDWKPSTVEPLLTADMDIRLKEIMVAPTSDRASL